jgi:hypothetical protein
MFILYLAFIDQFSTLKIGSNDVCGGKTRQTALQDLISFSTGPIRWKAELCSRPHA